MRIQPKWSERLKNTVTRRARARASLMNELVVAAGIMDARITHTRAETFRLGHQVVQLFSAV